MRHLLVAASIIAFASAANGAAPPKLTQAQHDAAHAMFEHAGPAARPKARVDLVKGSGSGRDAHRGGHAIGEAVEIIVGPEWLIAVRHRSFGRCMQVDDVEVGGVGERVPTEPTERQRKQLGSGNYAVSRRELPARSIAERDQSALSHSRVPLRHIERIATLVDELDTERKAAFVHEPPHLVEPDVI